MITLAAAQGPGERGQGLCLNLSRFLLQTDGWVDDDVGCSKRPVLAVDTQCGGGGVQGVYGKNFSKVSEAESATGACHRAGPRPSSSLKRPLRYFDASRLN